MSKVISFQIPKSGNTFVQYQEDRGKYFYNNLHQHPQCQLTVILEGRGQLLVGDYVGRFEAEDVFLLGENIPHVFRSDAEYFEEDNDLKIAGNTIFFDFQAFGSSMKEVEEFRDLLLLNDQINGCFKIHGETKRLIIELFIGFNPLNNGGDIWGKSFDAAITTVLSFSGVPSARAQANVSEPNNFILLTFALVGCRWRFQ